MSNARVEIDAKLAAVQEQLEKTLTARAAAERAVDEAEQAWRARQEALQAILSEEGGLRGRIGQLEQMRSALESANE